MSDTEGQPAFQHGGANAGYRCLLFGYREGGRGAVVMTNSDNRDELAREIFASIAAAYSWPDFKPIEKSVARVLQDRIASYAGSYEAPGNLPITIGVDAGQLYIQPAGYPKLQLLPASEDTSFDPDGRAPDVHFTR